MSAVPPLSTSGMPVDIRKGGSTAQAVYTAGLAFEQQLIEQMTQSLDLTGSSGSDDADSDTSDDAASSIETQMLPQALAQSLTDAGGLGLAAELARPYIQHSQAATDG